MSSVREIRKGVFELRAEQGYDAMGNRIRKFRTIHAKNKTVAKKMLSAFETELANGRYSDDERMPFVQYAEKWKENYGQTDLEPSTYETYLYILDSSIIPFFNKKRIGDIKTIHIVEYFNHERKLDPGQYALERRHRIIRSLFRKAKEWGIISDNPAMAVKKPRIVPREKEVYNENEIAQVLELINELPVYHQLIIKLALIGGLRRGEILALDIDDDIDYENNEIRIRHSLQYSNQKGKRLKSTKTWTNRVVTLPSLLMDELKQYSVQREEERRIFGDKWVGCNDDSGNKYFLLFGHPDGRPYFPKTITKMWNDFLNRHPNIKKISFHDLRHTSATYLLSNGVNIKVIQKRLGHKDIKTTLNIYAHVTEKDQDLPAEIFENIIKNDEKRDENDDKK